MIKKRAYISLFTGAGGFDLGLETAGFQPLFCVEHDDDARSSIKLNKPEWNLSKIKDIFECDPKIIRKELQLNKKELGLIAGGPPCQPFSKATFWVEGDSPRLNDARANTITAYFNFVNEFLPEVFILENVKGLIFKGKDDGLIKIKNLVKEINKRNKTNYQIHIIQTNAAEYGIPQVRERVFLIAHIEGKNFVKPNITHTSDEDILSTSNLLPYTTCWDAIGDLECTESKKLKVTGKWAGLLKSIPEGQNYLWHTDRGGGEPIFGWRTRYWTFLLKLAKDRPSWTISANPGPASGPFHWDNRLLSIKELSRLQTFPDDYIVQGDYRSARRQIGNAVPSALGELFGLAIRKQLFDEKEIDCSLSLIPSNKKILPIAKKAQPVPSQYKIYCGQHEAHPGTGLGPRAKVFNQGLNI